jgi:triphosphatase
MGAGRTEFELKFTGAPADLAALPASRLFAALAPDGGAWERLTSTYFDTAEGDLAKQGLSLRLREEGADYVQAVKAKGANCASRTEYEIAIEKAEDFPAPVGDERVDEIVESFLSRLVPVAGTAVDRWAAVVSYKGAEIELAVDLGEAESRDGEGRIFSGPLAELELELLSGDVASVFDLARLLVDNAHLRMSGGTKLETALALAEPGNPTPKRKKDDVDPETIAADVLSGALNDSAARLAELQASLIDYRRVEGVHQMRVALRRLRAIERIFRRYLKSDEIAELAAQAKAIAGRLGAARDWDVFLEETLPSASGDDHAPSGLRALKAKAEAARADAWGEAVAAVSERAFTAFLLDVLEAGTLGRWREDAKKALSLPAREFAPKVLGRALKKALRTAEETIGEADLAARHPLRIALKKLRYPIQLFRGAYPKEGRKEYMAALTALQDAFGAVNDAVVAQELAERAAGEGGEALMRAAGFVSGYKAAEAREAAKKIDAAWDAFEKTTPFWRKP